ncbi:MAG: glutamate--tRNA ligase [Candidatus Woesearchaeota archaeon]|nr:glutamate--tRNA ligase [Candidatus Woesearchaeota archaeon]
MDDRIRAHALQNALKYGAARTGNVIPKIIGEFPDVKNDMQATKAKIDAIVADVNTLSKEDVREELEKHFPEMLEKKQPKKRELPPLQNAEDGKVVTRLPPEPSKYNHLGHALTFLINAHYAKKYNGKLVLRFEDANPDKVSQEFVDEMLADIKEYLGIHVAAVHFVSDDMEQLYTYAEQLLEKKVAYMCFCPKEEMGPKRRAGEACTCREEHKDEWENFKNGKYMNGECVLRYKGDMQHKNSVLRDPVLFRAVQTPHFKQGEQYKIWPLYDFYSAIEEHLCGVTHVIRSNEFDMRKELQEQLQEHLGLRKPEMIHYGRFNISGATTKGREIREKIESGEYIGWDDPRLVTLRALKRRGIQKEAYETLIQHLGLSPYPVKLDFTMLAAENRKLLDATTNRYSFVADPVEVNIPDVEDHDVTLHLHPDKKEGGRVLHSKGEYLITKEDYEQSKGKTVRLMQDLTYKDGKVVEAKHDMIIHWLPQDGNVPVTVMMPDATKKKGMGEHTIKNLSVGDIVQFERFGFCKLDAVTDGVYEFWFTHE